VTLPSHSSQNEFPDNVSNHFKIRLPQPIRLEGQGWKVGLTAITLPDPTSQLPPFMKDDGIMFYSYWVVTDSSGTKSRKSANLKLTDLRSEDLETLTGVVL